MSKRKTRVPKDETKRDKFKRIVEPRVSKALKSIRLIGNCANTAYEYKPDDFALIVVTLRTEIEQLERKYQTGGVQDMDFALD